MTLKSKILKLVNYASENMGNDVLLSQTVDDIMELLKQAEFNGYVKGKDEGVNLWRKIKSSKLAIL